MKKLSIGLAVVGLMVATLLIGWFGFRAVATPLLSVGVWGFLLFCGWQLVTMSFLGLCWRVAAPANGSGHAAAFMWGRTIRDSAGSCLPFSQLGGLVLGARAAVLHGVAGTIATLSLVVDITAELLAEILFAIAGLIVLLLRSTNNALTQPIVIGLAVALVAVALVLGMQKQAVPLVRFGRNVLRSQFAAQLGPGGSEHQDRLDRELEAMFGHSGRVILCTAGHLIGWCFKGIGNWIAFRLLGADIDLVSGLAIEGLLHALLIPAFVIPGYAGVQEAGYAGLGALFGIPPEIALGVSLLRRGRDLAIGIPVLLMWQLVEMRRLQKPSTAR